MTNWKMEFVHYTIRINNNKKINKKKHEKEMRKRRNKTTDKDKS